MSLVASFLHECAAQGRWMRGLLALQASECCATKSRDITAANCAMSMSAGGSMAAADPHRHTDMIVSDKSALRRACLALAAATAPHNWSAALSLIQPDDAALRTRQVAHVLECLSRYGHVPGSEYRRWLITLLTSLFRRDEAHTPIASSRVHMDCTSCHASSSNAECTPTPPTRACELAVWLLFEHATRWTSYREALHVYQQAIAHSAVREPVKARAYARVRRLGSLHEQSSNARSAVVGSVRAWKDLLLCESSTPARLPGRSSGCDSPSSRPAEAQQRAHPSSLSSSSSYAHPVSHRSSDQSMATSHAIMQRHLIQALQSDPCVEDVGCALRVCTRAVASRRTAPQQPVLLSHPRWHDEWGGHRLAAHTHISVPRAHGMTTTGRRSRTSSSAKEPVLTLSWRIALATLGNQVMTEELWPLYVRVVGLCAPRLWCRALQCMTCPSEVDGNGAPGSLSSLQMAKDGASAAAASPSQGHDKAETKKKECVDGAVAQLLGLWVTSRANWRAAVVLAGQYLALRNGTAECAGTAGRDYASITRCDQSQKDDRGGSAHKRGRQRGDVFVLLVVDILSRIAVPPSVLYRLFPSPRTPCYTLPQQTRRAVAQALARGVRCDALQLSALAKRWAREGRWQAALQLYERFPNAEFQRRALQALLLLLRPAASGHESTRGACESCDALPRVGAAAQCAPRIIHRPTHATMRTTDLRSRRTTDAGSGPSMSPTPTTTTTPTIVFARCGERVRADDAVGHACVSELLALLDRYGRGRCPPSSYTTSTLIYHTSSWIEALHIFRGCVQRNATVKAQMLSALMDVGVPYDELTVLMHAYSSAVTPGIRARIVRLQQHQQQRKKKQ